MFGKAVSASIRSATRRFAGAKDGNVAVIFAIALLPVMAIVGAAIDYTRAASARSSMQAALDSTALMISRDAAANPSMSASAVEALATQYFKALYHNTDAVNVEVTASFTPNNSTNFGSTVNISGSGTVPTTFMKVVNIDTMDIGAKSTTKWGGTRMRVALVLDNTGSMSSNGKMDALKSAATDMITKLSAFNTTEGDVYISIVPFAKDVNVGTSNVNASWLNWTEWEAEPPYLTTNGYPSDWRYAGPGADCPFGTNNRTYGFECMDRPATLSGARSTDTIPSSGTYAGMICPSIDSGRKLPGKTSVYYNGCYTSVVDQVTTIDSGRYASCGSTPGCSCSGSGSSRVCKQTTYKHYWRSHPTDPNQAKNAAPPHSTWTGCVNDRDQNYDTTNDAMTGSGTPSKLPYPEQWKGCLPATVTAMSNQWSDLKTQIDNMTPSGNTNQAVGLYWGWQTLNTTDDPFKAPSKDSNWTYKDYIVLLSDGMNTQNRWSTNQSDIDARQEILCRNVKDPSKNGGNQITVFTIQVNVDNVDPTSQVLQSCATDGNFQMITSSGQTAGAFDRIVQQIAKLRIAQ
jgi:Flp pilus assembly protein TadG